ncbi:uncharacterized protein OCT59_010658 [Rhizophagus irregularis]|uniref:Uncharacterized protein n=2 Tax=Rhizophagus irregularis TaxID=588596 RepID=U9TLQ2_RHIID|nr:hypothetical protein GLOIN_2v1487478 [Rhizophagus irregularis DAOM 181602=DAOM 197198]EXX74068.1 hypothetical protein RirG_054570 [Rhizophagus irregularis DAOM 197198w]POG59857.1 hypothetical protein GLOIN_2v1487478 [Rhizophagus irregularis DAOM 181602=DAOM 197198]UZO19361.1 hypothetical protein OCT59_010658 [Rhizophagus irregularis]CAG8753315.1 6550_t:CDS:10 [Rhizophagus irregularis]|eukprot:XP_025166723.1 hypothetical protein GLOIN_2v1487478 [Rhizophagus irregularis DAOM 181602=DAOM 197198]
MPSNVTKKQRSIDWMFSCNNPTPIEFFRFIQPTRKTRAIENYGKFLEQAIGLCEDPRKVSKLENVKKTSNCDSDWNIWLIEKRATNTEIHRELNSVVSKKARKRQLKKQEDDDEYDEDIERAVSSNESSPYSTSYVSSNESSNESYSDSSFLLRLLKKYCEKESTSLYDFIIDLSPSLKIKGQFNNGQWTELVKRRPGVVKNTYHYEIEPLVAHLFSQDMDLSQAREKWHELRNVAAPTYNDGFSYAKNDWDKIKRWVERVTGQFLDAFESPRNDCHEREWTGDYIIPLIQGALKLDGKFRVPWGEVSVLATLRRRNNDKDILAEQVERGYQVDILCNCEQYEIACALVCGGPYSYDLTKLASDEFNLPRIMKDMLDDLEMKFLYSGKNGMELYIVEIQAYMTEVRIYLIEKREIYFFHHLKTFNLPLTFSTYKSLKCALRVAWYIRGLLNSLVQELNTVNAGDDGGFKTPPTTSSVNKKTMQTPSKQPKRKRRIN